MLLKHILSDYSFSEEAETIDFSDFPSRENADHLKGKHNRFNSIYAFNQSDKRSNKAGKNPAVQVSEFDSEGVPPRSNEGTGHHQELPIQGVGQTEKSSEGAAFSPKKENKVNFRTDEWGVVQLPRSPKYKFASILTMRTMQFYLARELGCEFAIDEDGDVWICDPKGGDWMIESEAFGSSEEVGMLPLKKMISILNSDSGEYYFDIESYNYWAKERFGFWQFNCENLGKDMKAVVSKKSIGLHLREWLEKNFGIEFERLEDCVA